MIIRVLDMPCTIRKTLSHSSRRIIISKLKDFDKIIQRHYDRYQEGVEIERHRMSGE